MNTPLIAIGGRSRWRTTTVAVVSGSLLAFSLVTPQSADAAISDPTAPAPASIGSAAWLQQKPKAGGAYAARSVINLAPHGTAIWGATITAGTDAIPAGSTLNFSGVPAGMKLASAHLPSAVTAEQSATIGSCTPSGGTVACALSDQIPAGSTKIVAVSLTDPGSPTPASYPMQVSLTNGESPLATTAIRAQIAAGTRDSLYVYTAADRLSHQGAPLQRVTHVYNLGGAKRKAAKTRITLTNLLPKRASQAAKLKGNGWDCTPGNSAISCTWQGKKFPAGTSTSPLTIVHVLTASSRRGIPVRDGSQKLLWTTKVSGSNRIATTQHRQVLNMLPPAGTDPLTKAKTRYLRTAQLTLSGAEMSKSRIGGTGRYLVMINNGGGKTAHRATLSLKLPSHAKVIKVKAKGWTCTKAGVCTNRKPIKSHRSAPSVEYTIKSNGNAHTKANGVVAGVIKWDGKGEKRKDRYVYTKSWHPALRVKASSTSAAISTGMRAVRGNLNAYPKGTDGGKYVYIWKQVCPAKGACPKVKWVGPRKSSSKEKLISASYTPPTVRKRTVLRFQVTVRQGGAVARKTVKVVAEPPVKRHKPNTVHPDVDPKLPPRLDRSGKLSHKLKPIARAWIGSRGITKITAGQKKTLVAHVKMLTKKQPIKKMIWRIDGRSVKKTPGAKVISNGSRLTMRASKKASGASIVTLIVTHKGGRQTVATEIVQTRRKTGALNRVTELNAPSVQASSTESFCDMFTQAQSGSLTSFTIDSIAVAAGQTDTSATSCTASNAAITLTSASFTLNGMAFTGVVGKITAAGVTFNSGFVNLPGSNGPQGPQLLTFTAKPALFVPFTANGLSGMTGTVNLSALTYLSLPVGWKVVTSQIAVSFSGGVYRAAVNVQAAAPSPETGSALITGTLASDGSVNLNVTATDLMPIVGSNGSTTVFSGTGTITSSAGQNAVYNISIAMVPPTGGVFPIYGDLGLSNAKIAWSNTGFSFSANGIVSANNTTYTVGLTGNIQDFADWSLTVSSNAVIITFENLSVDNPSGTISSTRNASTGQATLAMDLSVGVQFHAGDDDSLNVTSVTGHLGIFCPPGNTDPSCANAQLQLQLDIVGTLTWWDNDTLPVNSTVDVNLQNGEFSLGVGLDSNTAITQLESDSGMQFSNVTGFYSEDPANDVALAGNPCMTGAQLAQATEVKGAIGSFTDSSTGTSGNFIAIAQDSGTDTAGSFGFCLAGTYGGSGADASFDMPTGTGSFLAAGFVFTQYGTTLIINGVSTLLQGYDLVAWGEYHLPDSISGLFSGGALVAMFTKTIGAGGQFSWTLSADIDIQADYLVGGPTSTTSLAFDQAGITIAMTTCHQQVGCDDSGVPLPGPVLSMGLNVQLLLATSGMTAADGSPGYSGSNSTPAPVSMPITGYIGFSFGGIQSGSWSLVAKLGNNITTWNNAFGVSGLDINDIVITAQVGPIPLTNFIGFGASVTTPTDNTTTIGRLTSYLGIQPDTTISFAVQLSDVSPCFALSIGNPAGTTLAINAFEGALQADYFELYIAPEGCATANNLPNMPSFGYAADFTGSILGVQAVIHGLYSVAGDGADIVLDVDIEQFNIAGLDVKADPGATCTGNALNGPCIKFDADLLTQSVDLTFSGAINLWGALFVGVSGSMNFDIGGANPVAALSLTGSADLDLFGIFNSDAALTLSTGFQLDTTGGGSSGWSPSWTGLDIGATLPMFYYFINTEVTLAFDYAGGIVSLVYAQVQVTVNLIMLQGNVTVTLAYCNPATGDICDVVGNPSDPGSITTPSTNGDLDIIATGTVKYWLWGWQSHTATILNASIPIDFQNPVATPPASTAATVPAPPINTWANPTWDYSTEMFMLIPWSASDLVAATGLDSSYATNGLLRYGAPVTDPSLTAPSAKFNTATLDITGVTQSSDGASTTVQVVAQLPETPTYAQVAGLDLPASRLANALPAFGKCSGTQTESFAVKIPTWDGSHPLSTSSAALIIAEINWRIYLGSVIETSSIAAATNPAEILASYQCGFGTITGATASNPTGTSSTDNWQKFPSLQSWYKTNQLGERINLGYPQQPPADTSQFCTANNVPANVYGQACLTNLSTGLNSAWGTGWGAGGSA